MKTIYHFGIKGMKWGIRRYQNKNGTLTAAGKKRYAEDSHPDYKKAHSGKSVRNMSDQELRSVNNRLQMERQYSQLTKKTSNGKKYVQRIISTAGTLAAVEGAYKTYKRFGDQAIEQVGSMVLNELKRSGW